MRRFILFILVLCNIFSENIAQSETMLALDWYNNWLASINEYGVFKVVNTSNQQILLNINPSQQVLLNEATVKFSNNGAYLAIGIQKSLIVYTTQNWQLQSVFEVGEPTGLADTEFYEGVEGIVSIAWKPSNDYIALSTLSNRIVVIDLSANQVIKNVEFGNIPAQFNWYTNTTELWSGSIGIDYQNLELIPSFVQVPSIDYSPGTTVITTSSLSPNRMRYAYSDVFGRLRTVDLPSRNADTVINDLYPDLITSLDWSSDGTRLAIADVSGSIHIWNQVEKELSLLVENTTSVNAIAFNPNGNEIAYGGDNTPIQFIDVPLDQPSPTPSPTFTPTPAVVCNTTVASGNSAGSPYVICL